VGEFPLFIKVSIEKTSIMRNSDLVKLLESVKANQLSIEDAISCFSGGHQKDFHDYANIDHNRQDRTDIPEVIFGENKTPEQISGIMGEMLKFPRVVFATRVVPEKAEKVCESMPKVKYYSESRILCANESYIAESVGRGKVLVISAGTSDIPVAEEAYRTLICLGHEVGKKYDIGVAGIHRLLSCVNELQEASVVIVVAGMEGALPSVVAGLIGSPVVAVPTSIGYGVGAGGVAALLGMLNSCSPGVAVVNIDNGFGAGCMAAAINRKKL
jgi:NCAIR mutase (PurE)-related protein